MVFHVISAPARYKSLEYSWHPAMPACCRACYVVLCSMNLQDFVLSDKKPISCRTPTPNPKPNRPHIGRGSSAALRERITSTPGASTRATHPAAGYVHPHIRILGISTARARLEESAGGRGEVRPTVPAHRAHCFGDAIRFHPSSHLTPIQKTCLSPLNNPTEVCRHKGKRVPQMSDAQICEPEPRSHTKQRHAIRN